MNFLSALPLHFHQRYITRFLLYMEVWLHFQPKVQNKVSTLWNYGYTSTKGIEQGFYFMELWLHFHQRYRTRFLLYGIVVTLPPKVQNKVSTLWNYGYTSTKGIEQGFYSMELWLHFHQRYRTRFLLYGIMVTLPPKVQNKVSTLWNCGYTSTKGIEQGFYSMELWLHFHQRCRKWFLLYGIMVILPPKVQKMVSTFLNYSHKYIKIQYSTFSKILC